MTQRGLSGLKLTDKAISRLPKLRALCFYKPMKSVLNFKLLFNLLGVIFLLGAVGLHFVAAASGTDLHMELNAGSLNEPRDRPLPHVQPLEEFSYSDLDVSCSEMRSSVESLKSHFSSNNRLITQFAGELHLMAEVWHRQLLLKEGRVVSFPERYFDPVLMSIQNMNSATASIFQLARHNEESFEQLAFEVVNCEFYNIEIEDQLFKLMSMTSEHLDTTAIYLSQMEGVLMSSYSRWAEIEGVEQRVPENFFKSLVSVFKSFSEAKTLIFSNSREVESEINEALNLLPSSP